MIFIGILLKYLMLFNKIEIIKTKKYNVFTKKWKRFLNKEKPMGKDHWNRKRVYSIRKFTVGTCSVLIGTCAILFGTNLANISAVSADETPVAVATENVDKEITKEEAVVEKAPE